MTKLLLIPLKPFLKVLDYINPRIYMGLYNFLLRSAGVNMNGVPRYISQGAKFDNLKSITLSDRVVISDRVILLTHDYSYTTAMIAVGENPPVDISIQRGIYIGRNVFVGMGSILLPGVHVEDNCIIGAGSVVRGRIAEGSVIFGNPAIPIKDIRDLGNSWISKRNNTIFFDKE